MMIGIKGCTLFTLVAFVHVGISSTVLPPPGACNCTEGSQDICLEKVSANNYSTADACFHPATDISPGHLCSPSTYVNMTPLVGANAQGNITQCSQLLSRDLDKPSQFFKVSSLGDVNGPHLSVTKNNYSLVDYYGSTTLGSDGCILFFGGANLTLGQYYVLGDDVSQAVSHAIDANKNISSSKVAMCGYLNNCTLGDSTSVGLKGKAVLQWCLGGPNLPSYWLQHITPIDR